MSNPMTTWLSRSRMNERITRGENWPLASCRLTTVSENTTPAVVIVAPATVLSSQVAALLLTSRVSGTGRSAPSASSTVAVASARPAPRSTMIAGRKNRLSRNRYKAAATRSSGSGLGRLLTPPAPSSSRCLQSWLRRPLVAAGSVRAGRSADRSGRPGRVLPQRHLAGGPRGPDWLEDAPALLGLDVADRQGRVPGQQLAEQDPVGGQLRAGQGDPEHLTLEVERVAGAVEVELEGDAVGLQAHAQHAGLGPAGAERQVGDRLEVDGDLPAVGPEGLAGAQPERHPGPAPVVHGDGELGVGLGAAGGVDAVLGGVVGQLPARHGARGVAAAHGVAGHVRRRGCPAPPVGPL